MYITVGPIHDKFNKAFSLRKLKIYNISARLKFPRFIEECCTHESQSKEAFH